MFQPPDPNLDLPQCVEWLDIVDSMEHTDELDEVDGICLVYDNLMELAHQSCVSSNDPEESDQPADSLDCSLLALQLVTSVNQG
jgi:hypothetical protein